MSKLQIFECSNAMQDSQASLTDLIDALRKTDHQFEVSPMTAVPSKDCLKDTDVVIINASSEEDDKLEFIQSIRCHFPSLPIITTNCSFDAGTIIQGMGMGVFDTVNVSGDNESLKVAIDTAAKSITSDTVELPKKPAGSPSELVGNSHVMRELYKAIGKVACHNVTILIRGESGTGKELVARALHNHSLRSENAFVTLNCAAIPRTLLESKLFGHEKGAFTGAANSRIGKFEQAQGGTIFLDEIGELAPGTQAKLLRALQFKQIERVGGSELIDVDVRIIAATNLNLEQAVRNGDFREDLFHRLNILPIYTPPLRDHKEDLPLLIRSFIARIAEDNHYPLCELSAKALDILYDYDWPGNVRELEHCVYRAVIMGGGYPITASAVTRILTGPSLSEDAPDTRELVRQFVRHYLHSNRHSRKMLKSYLEQAEEAMLREALQRAQNQTNAAKLLSISRPSVQAKIKKYNIEQKTVVTS